MKIHVGGLRKYKDEYNLQTQPGNYRISTSSNVPVGLGFSDKPSQFESFPILDGGGFFTSFVLRGSDLPIIN